MSEDVLEIQLIIENAEFETDEDGIRTLVAGDLDRVELVDSTTEADDE